MSASERKCAGQVYDGRCRFYSCTRKPTLQEAGKDWCWQHAPSAEAARKQASSDRFQAQMAADNKRWAEKEKRETRAAACMAVLDGLDPEALPALIEAAKEALLVLENDIAGDCPYCGGEGGWSDTDDYDPRPTPVQHKSGCQYVTLRAALAALGVR